MDSVSTTFEALTSTCVVIPCLYCHSGIDAASFVYWSSTKRLVSVTCPSCERRVTITASTWQRWSRDASLEDAR